MNFLPPVLRRPTADRSSRRRTGAALDRALRSAPTMASRDELFLLRNR